MIIQQSCIKAQRKIIKDVQVHLYWLWLIPTGTFNNMMKDAKWFKAASDGSKQVKQYYEGHDSSCWDFGQNKPQWIENPSSKTPGLWSSCQPDCSDNGT